MKVVVQGKPVPPTLLPDYVNPHFPQDTEVKPQPVSAGWLALTPGRNPILSGSVVLVVWLMPSLRRVQRKARASVFLRRATVAARKGGDCSFPRATLETDNTHTTIRKRRFPGHTGRWQQ